MFHTNGTVAINKDKIPFSRVHLEWPHMPSTLPAQRFWFPSAWSFLSFFSFLLTPPPSCSWASRHRAWREGMSGSLAVHSTENVEKKIHYTWTSSEIFFFIFICHRNAYCLFWAVHVSSKAKLPNNYNFLILKYLKYLYIIYCAFGWARNLDTYL